MDISSLKYECKKICTITEENELVEWPQIKNDVNILQKCLQRGEKCKMLFYNLSKFINLCTHL